jgi:hypothetical protein
MLGGFEWKGIDQDKDQLLLYVTSMKEKGHQSCVSKFARYSPGKETEGLGGTSARRKT